MTRLTIIDPRALLEFLLSCLALLVLALLLGLYIG